MTYMRRGTQQWSTYDKKNDTSNKTEYVDRASISMVKILHTHAMIHNYNKSLVLHLKLRILSRTSILT